MPGPWVHIHKRKETFVTLMQRFDVRGGPYTIFVEIWIHQISNYLAFFKLDSCCRRLDGVRFGQSQKSIDCRAQSFGGCVWSGFVSDKGKFWQRRVIRISQIISTLLKTRDLSRGSHVKSPLRRYNSSLRIYMFFFLCAAHQHTSILGAPWGAQVETSDVSHFPTNPNPLTPVES